MRLGRGSAARPERRGPRRLAGRATRIFLALLAAAFVAYLAALSSFAVARSRCGRCSSLAVAIQLLPLAAPLLLSTDAWTYWEYGRIAAVHDGNPYVDTPSEFPDDPAYEHAGAAWRETTSVYGPAFTLVSEAVALVSGSSAAAAAWIFKVLAALAVLACALLAARLARDRPFALAFVGWNPLLAIHFAGGGHNDALMMALVLAPLALGAVGRRGLAGASWVASIFVKWVPVVFLALRTVEARASGRRVGHLGFALAAVALARAGDASLRPRLAARLRPARAERGGADELRASASRRAARRSARHRPRARRGSCSPAGLALAGPRGRCAAGPISGLAGCLLLATTPWLTPWYTIWALPLAAVDDDRRAQLLALGFCAYLLPQTIPL